MLMEIEEEPRVVVETRPPTTRRLGAWWLVWASVVISLALAVDRLLWGSVLLASSIALGAGLRLVLSEERAGGLVVRSRALDVTLMLVLAAALLVSGLTLDLSPR